MTGWDDEDEKPAADTVEKLAPLADGIHKDVPFEHYLQQDRVSKGVLWTTYTHSPAHARIEPESSNFMKVGSATHCVLLEPDSFRDRYKRGPEDRRGNKWKVLQSEYGEYLLTAEEYDNALALRDAIRHNPYIKKLTGNGAYREVTACATDPITGLKTRMRADGYVPGDGILQDVKTTTDARAEEFVKKVKAFGYHLQEAHYTKTWKDAGGDSVAFIFIVVEPKPPYAVKIYELDADAVAEGEAIRQKAMETWLRCVESGEWPAYSQEPEVIGLRKFDYRETVPVNG